MPTPFMHLQVAERIRDAAFISEKPKELICQVYPAFYLGNVAPDFQIICDVPREETHFYDLPPSDGARAYPEMFERYPQLSDPGSLSADHALFIAGYCSHLILDLLWYRQILVPFFLSDDYFGQWESHSHRFLIHNTLLTYLDKMAVESLPDTAYATLASAEPGHWLPFADDADLLMWRNMLVEQLQPGALLKTIEIYASRLSMTTDEFSMNLENIEWLNNFVFDKVPLGEVFALMDAAVVQSVDFISDYLSVLE